MAGTFRRRLPPKEKQKEIDFIMKSFSEDMPARLIAASMNIGTASVYRIRTKELKRRRYLTLHWPRKNG